MGATEIPCQSPETIKIPTAHYIDPKVAGHKSFIKFKILLELLDRSSNDIILMCLLQLRCLWGLRFRQTNLSLKANAQVNL